MPQLQAKNAFSLVLAEDNKIYWWIGFDESPQITTYSYDGIRRVLLEERKANPELMVLVKPMDKSRYANVVDILDEIDITNITRYAIVEVTEEDMQRIQRRR